MGKHQRATEPPQRPRPAKTTTKALRPKPARPSSPVRPRPAKQVVSIPKPRARKRGSSDCPVSKRARTSSSKSASSKAHSGYRETEATAPRMDTSHGATSSKASADSASTSNSPSEEAQSTSAGQSRGSGDIRGSPLEFTGALSSFLKRTFEENSGSSRFSAMFRDLKSDDPNRQLMALTELSEYLSFSSEEALISFPMETFIPVLISLLEDPGHGEEAAAQAMLLCCRCLFNVVDILPPTTRIITAAGGLPVLCANLLNVAYIDVAELAVAIIERISEDQPLQVLKAGGLQAILTFLDFFQIAVQRQAASAAALMLLPIPPSDVFDQHVRSVLPTLSQLLQHSDPQVLQSVCECWRRVLDNAISIQTRSRTGSACPAVPQTSLGRMVAKGKNARWPGEKSKKDKDDSPETNASGSGSLAVPLSSVLEEMCPSGMVSRLLMLLSNGISAPSPHTSVIMGEVLYILSVLTNYSDASTKDALQQDICSLLRQMVLAMDLMQGGPSSSQTSFALLRVLACVASLLPAIHLNGSLAECEEKRLAVFQETPEHIEALAEAFLPSLVDIHEASTDPCVQSLCITLLLTFFLTCRECPEIIRRSLEPTRLACFLANLLCGDCTASSSKSATLAALLIVNELLEKHPTPYTLLFVRHGVVRAIHRLVARGSDDESQRSSRASSKPSDSKVRTTKAITSPKARASNSRAQAIEEAANRVLSSYFTSTSTIGESMILKSLGVIARQLRSSPSAVVAAHREALSKLHDLLLANDGITAFEFACSGTASALNEFLYPDAASLAGMDLNTVYGDRLRLFLESIGKTSSGAFATLVRLCVSAVQRSEQQPLTLFPTHASLSVALPPHLRLQLSQVGGKSDSDLSRSGLSLGGEMPLGLGSRLGGRGSESASSASTSLSVLRLLAKPVRVRMGAHGASGTQSSTSSSMPNFRTLMTPFSSKATPPRFLEAKAGSQASASSSATNKAPASDLVGSSTASPAARLRNYLASKVSRKRSASSNSSAPLVNATASSDKRSGVASLLSKAGRAAIPLPSNQASMQMPEDWPSASDMEEASKASEDNSTGPLAARLPEASGQSSARSFGSLDAIAALSRLRDRERDMGENVEAVLLVEPLASVSALEDYVWERHGPRQSVVIEPSGPCASASQAPPPTAAPPNASMEGSSGSSEHTSSTFASEAIPGGRVRLFAKQSSQSTPRDWALPSTPPTANSPRTPVTTIDTDPAFPPEAMLPPSAMQVDESAPKAPPASFTPAVASQSPPKKRVQIYLNGNSLSSRTSIVQALVSHATRLPRARAPPPEETRQRDESQRFLAFAEDECNSEPDDSAETSSLSSNTSSRLFCGTIWGRVHGMTYEMVEDTTALAQADKLLNSADALTADTAVVDTDFDCLVKQHQRIVASIQSLQECSTEGGPCAAPLTENSETGSTDLATSGEKEDVSSIGTPRSCDKSVPVDHEALAMMLQLISAFHNMSEYLRSCQGPMASEISGVGGTVEEDSFQCRSLTSKLLRQLSDPLAICTGSMPAWCTKLPGTCRYLFPNNARRILHYSCNLGLSRALHHVQQRTLAQNAHSQEMQRRLEGEVAVANIPRQKVRISRQRLLESAIKVMNLYGAANTILEVEYIGEVGTGSGPTLEFYAQVAEILRTSEPALFRQGVPGGMLFPQPYDPEWLQAGQEQAPQILERFRLLGQIVAKCILDNRLVDLQLHPFFWRAVLGNGPFSQRSLRDVDPALYASMEDMRGYSEDDITAVCADFTLPGHSKIELTPGGASKSLSRSNLDEYIRKVSEATLVSSIAPQVVAFRNAFSELLPLETCRIWSEIELASLILGSSVSDNAFWTTEHLTLHIKAQHGYNADSRCFRDLLSAMSEFSTETRRRFLTFVTGAPSLPIGGFGGLKPPLTVVKKESPPAPLTPDQFMPSVMTCANYLKLPEYSSAEILRQKLGVAMLEGQSAFLLS